MTSPRAWLRREGGRLTGRKVARFFGWYLAISLSVAPLQGFNLVSLTLGLLGLVGIVWLWESRPKPGR